MIEGLLGVVGGVRGSMGRFGAFKKFWWGYNGRAWERRGVPRTPSSTPEPVTMPPGVTQSTSARDCFEQFGNCAANTRGIWPSRSSATHL